MKISNLLWGILLIVVGVIFGLNALDIADVKIFFKGWWTLFIIVPCFIDLFKDENKTGNIIGLIIGIALLLASQDIISFETIWKLLLPFILIVIGISIIFKDVIGSKIKKEIKKLNQNTDKEYYATFSSQNMEFDNDFKGTTINSIFGSFKCDLRNCSFNEDIVINTVSVFGGIDIYVPNDVNIKVKSSSIFGGVDNKSKNKDGKVTIYINATCIFGGVEIK